MLSAAGDPLFVTDASQINPLSDHWVASQNCYRDELNHSDVDYNNCWTDNAGKILTMSAITGDNVDASHSLNYIENHTSPDYYMPEAVINGSNLPPITTFPSVNGVLPSSSSITLTNRIVQLEANNNTLDESSNATARYSQLAVGSYYSGATKLAYIGVDRVWSGGQAYISNSSEVFEIKDGFSKRSFFEFNYSMFYVYLNATLLPESPYINISIQVEYLETFIQPISYVFLQTFSASDFFPFSNASLFSSNGTLNETMPQDGAMPAPGSGGMLIAYSNQSNVFTQDAVLIRFSSNDSAYDVEHWFRDGAFQGLSWLGVGYYVTTNSGDYHLVDKLSPPINATVYPVNHFDYHLLSDTVKYVATSTAADVSVAPPVGFGFISYGLALDAAANPHNTTMNNFASGYWNYYYARYNGSNYSTPYARSINLLALAGFKLYGCNATVENFTRRFIGNTSGSSIEEFGWGAAALYQLKSCTGNASDSSLYNSFVDSFGTSGSHFIILYRNAQEANLDPLYTFQFGEAASGLMLGGIPFNNPVVMGAMNAVYQSDVNGTVLNEPYQGDLANTETLPAYLLSTWLFQNEMRNATGYWISGLDNMNVTSIDYVNGTLLIGATGNDGVLQISSSAVSRDYHVNGFQTLEILNNATSTLTTTKTTTTTTITTTGCLQCVQIQWIYILAAVIVVLSASLGFLLFTRRR